MDGAFLSWAEALWVFAVPPGLLFLGWRQWPRHRGAALALLIGAALAGLRSAQLALAGLDPGAPGLGLALTVLAALGWRQSLRGAPGTARLSGIETLVALALAGVVLTQLLGLAPELLIRR